MTDDPYNASEIPNEPEHDHGDGVLPFGPLTAVGVIVLFYLLYYFIGPVIG